MAVQFLNDKSIPRIMVLSKMAVENIMFSDLYKGIKCIYISITTPDDPIAKISDMLYGEENILRLVFDDMDPRDYVDDQDLVEKNNFIFFDDNMANKILDFVFIKNKYSIDSNHLLIVHCDAGISRSAGVAAAISKITFDDDMIFFENLRPHTFVYNKLLKEYHKRYEYSI